MASKRVIASAVDWAAFSAKIPANQKTQFHAFKSKSDAYLRSVGAQKDSLDVIHWDNYRSSVKVAGMVDDFKKQYESYQVPYPSQQDYMDKITEKEKKDMKRVDVYVAKSKALVVDYTTERERLSKIPPTTTMTVDEFVVHWPEYFTSVEHPTMWPHGPEDQPGYVAESKEEKKEE